MNETITEIEKLPAELQQKLADLKEYIAGLGSLAVGFSGGVDSTFLITAAREVLGEKALAVTSTDVMVPGWERREAQDFCRENGIRQIVCQVDPLQEEEFRNNGPNRCYFCKKLIFSEVMRVAAEQGIEYVAEGSNMDDLGDYRPGLKAAEDLGVKAPLREAKLYKEEIRQLSKAMGLPTWDKPAFACLASRFVYGEEITEEKLHMVDLAEQVLLEEGFRQERVRIHGDVARIEVAPRDIPRIAEDAVRERVDAKLREIGFRYVALDLRGYRTGSMNEALPKEQE